jgi:hypothetical protein
MIMRRIIVSDGFFFFERSKKIIFDLDPSEEDSDEISFKSPNSEDEENLHRTPSSLNNYSVLPPIKSSADDQNFQPQYFIKQLQEKYQQQNGFVIFE